MRHVAVHHSVCAPVLNTIMIMTEPRPVNQHEREPKSPQRVRELISAFTAHQPSVEFSSWKLNTGMEDVDMSRVKQVSKRKRLTKAAGVPALGAAGLSFSLVGGASASALPTTDVPQSLNTTPNQRFLLGEEEMADVSLATFHLFDRESGTAGLTQIARGGCGGCGCRGCGGGCRVGGGCGGGCRVGGCGCRGCGCGGCGGLGLGLGILGLGAWGIYGGCGYGGCCVSWGYCRYC